MVRGRADGALTLGTRQRNEPESLQMAGSGRTVASVIWVVAARQSERLLGIINVAILARLLNPADFGLVAMAGSVVALVEMFTAFGFDWALLRIQNPTRQQYDAAWTFRLMVGIAVSVSMIALSYPAAMYLGRPEVVGLIAAMSANSIIGAVENIGLTDFRRYMQYDKEFTVRFSGKIVGCAVTIAIAYMYRSYWALVLGTTAARVTTTILSYVMHSFRPKLNFGSRKELLGFSIWMLLSNLSDTIGAKFSELWIGKVLGSASVGIYSLAVEISTMAISEVAAPINRVMYSVYSGIAGRKDALRDAYLLVSGVIWIIGLPAAIGLGLCAPEAVSVFLGDKWGGVVPVLQLLAIAGVVNVMSANTHYVYWAMDRSRFVTLLSVISASIFVLLTLFFGAWRGLLGVAIAQVVASSLHMVINMSVLRSTLDLKVIHLVRNYYRVALSSVIMASVVLLLRHTWLDHSMLKPLVRLVVMAAAGSVTYFVSLVALWTLSGKPAGAETHVLRVIFRRGR